MSLSDFVIHPCNFLRYIFTFGNFAFSLYEKLTLNTLNFYGLKFGGDLGIKGVLLHWENTNASFPCLCTCSDYHELWHISDLVTLCFQRSHGKNKKWINWQFKYNLLSSVILTIDITCFHFSAIQNKNLFYWRLKFNFQVCTGWNL